MGYSIIAFHVFVSIITFHVFVPLNHEVKGQPHVNLFFELVDGSALEIRAQKSFSFMAKISRSWFRKEKNIVQGQPHVRLFLMIVVKSRRNFLDHVSFFSLVLMVSLRVLCCDWSITMISLSITMISLSSLKMLMDQKLYKSFREKGGRLDNMWSWQEQSSVIN